MLRPTVILLAASTLAGCGALSRDAPEVRAYVLQADRPGPPRDGSATDALEVRRFRISPRYDARSFVYRRSEHAYESDFYHEFFASPADLVTEQARRWLEASGLYSHVIGPESRVLGETVLEGNVTSLYGDYSGGADLAVLEVQFFLVGEPGSRVLMDRTERVELPLDGRGPEALARGWSRGLAQILGRLEVALAELDVPAQGGAGEPADGT